MDFRARGIATLGLLTLLVSMPGCATWFTGNYQDPEVHLIKVEVVKARLLQQQFVLRFRIDNPNDSSLPIRGISYRIHLNDLLLVDGEASDWFTVAAESREYYDIPVRTNLWQHLREIAKMLEHSDRPIRYNLEGELRTGVLFGHDVPLHRSAEIIPGALLQN